MRNPDLDIGSKYPYSFPPETVACARGRFPNQTFDAELKFDGQHYLVSTGHKDRESATAAAKVAMDALLIVLRSAAKSVLARYKIAEA